MIELEPFVRITYLVNTGETPTHAKGYIERYLGDVIPEGWEKCNGQIMEIKGEQIRIPTQEELANADAKMTPPCTGHD